MTPEEVYSLLPRDLIKSQWCKIFDFDFPLVQGMSKEELCTIILKHYFMREIAGETVPLWMLWLESKMQEIMPYYADLSAATISMADAFRGKNITETVKRDGADNEDVSRASKMDTNTAVDTTTQSTNDVDKTSTQSTDISNQELFSDTPQNGLGPIEDMSYLTNATINTGHDSGTSKEEQLLTIDSTSNQKLVDSKVGSETENRDKSYLENVNRVTEGFDGDRVGTLVAYRETLLQIPRLIIRDLSDLFFAIY